MKLPAAEPTAATSMVELLDRHFHTWLDHVAPGDDADTLRQLFGRALYDPAREFLDRPGKEFRGRLTACAWEMSGRDAHEIPRELPLVVEILHAGSLIIDDIQDGSRRRRGRPALHRICGTPAAINIANLFYCWPLDLLGKLDIPPTAKLEVYRRASTALLRCHQGQGLDLSVRAFEVPQGDIASVVASSTELKAGTLMEFAAALGAAAAGADPAILEALARFGRKLGTALQMLDDLSGVVNDARRHKGEEDLRLARPTWVWTWLSRHVGARAYHRLQRQARRVAAGSDPAPLAASFGSLIESEARAEVHRALDVALSGLRRRFGANVHVEFLQTEIDRLEMSFV